MLLNIATNILGGLTHPFACCDSLPLTTSCKHIVNSKLWCKWMSHISYNILHMSVKIFINRKNEVTEEKLVSSDRPRFPLPEWNFIFWTHRNQNSKWCIFLFAVFSFLYFLLLLFFSRARLLFLCACIPMKGLAGGVHIQILLNFHGLFTLCYSHFVFLFDFSAIPFVYLSTYVFTVWKSASAIVPVVVASFTPCIHTNPLPLAFTIMKEEKGMFTLQWQHKLFDNQTMLASSIIRKKNNEMYKLEVTTATE